MSTVHLEIDRQAAAAVGVGVEAGHMERILMVVRFSPARQFHFDLYLFTVSSHLVNARQQSGHRAQTEVVFYFEVEALLIHTQSGVSKQWRRFEFCHQNANLLVDNVEEEQF